MYLKTKELIHSEEVKCNSVMKYTKNTYLHTEKKHWYSFKKTYTEITCVFEFNKNNLPDRHKINFFC